MTSTPTGSSGSESRSLRPSAASSTASSFRSFSPRCSSPASPTWVGVRVTSSALQDAARGPADELGGIGHLARLRAQSGDPEEPARRSLAPTSSRWAPTARSWPARSTAPVRNMSWRPSGGVVSAGPSSETVPADRERHVRLPVPGGLPRRGRTARHHRWRWSWTRRPMARPRGPSIRTILWSRARSASIVLVLVSQIVARRVTAPLDDLVGFVRTLGSSELTAERAQVGPDEIGALAEAFNGMLDRLEQSRAALVRSEKLGLAGSVRGAGRARHPQSAVVDQDADAAAAVASLQATPRTTTRCRRCSATSTRSSRWCAT